jgi:hypothetical protein
MDKEDRLHKMHQGLSNVVKDGGWNMRQTSVAEGGTLTFQIFDIGDRFVVVRISSDAITVRNTTVKASADADFDHQKVHALIDEALTA